MNIHCDPPAPATRTRRNTRRIAVISLAAAGLTLALTACSSGSSGGSDQASDITVPSSATTESADAASSLPPSSQASATARPDASPITTFRTTASGASVTAALTAGRPSRTPPPAYVLNACTGWSDPANEDSSVYVAAQLTVAYTGSITTKIELQPRIIDLEKQTDYGDAEFQSVAYGTENGGMFCGADVATYDAQPDQTFTIGIWFDLRIRTNAHPTVTAQDTHYLLVTAPAIFATSPPADPTSVGYYSASGSHAASCAGRYSLGGGLGDANNDTERGALLYSTAPLSYSYTDPTNGHVTGRCTAA